MTNREINDKEFVIKLLTDYKTQLEFVNIEPLAPKEPVDYRPHLLREELLGIALFMINAELAHANSERFIPDAHLNFAIGMIQGILLSTNFVTIHKLMNHG